MRAGWAAAGGLLTALAAGTVADVPKASVSRSAGGYHVLAADLHVHSLPFSWSTLSPFDTVIEAGHQGLDVIAMTPHNHVWVAKAGAWFSRRIGGPLVLVAEEIASPRYHLLAIGITETVSSSLRVSSAIDEIHRQGGVAIAAHPYEPFWPAYDADALQKLDGAEVVRPESQHDEALGSQLRAFFGRAKLTAVGASDYHGVGALGYSRTYVFAREPSRQEVLEALRAGRTVTYDRGRPLGDPAMIRLASESGLPRSLPEWRRTGSARLFSALGATLALAGWVLANRWS